MQPSINLKLSVAQQKFVKANGDIISLLNPVIEANDESIGYFLQAYYPREKMRGVKILPNSILVREVDIAFTITYTLEEFNACSAINTEDRKEMAVTITIDQIDGALKLVGEYWPEA